MRYLLIGSVVAIVSCTNHRQPPLPTGFWQLNGDSAARQALARGDSSLVLLEFPDSSGLAFEDPVNLEVNPEHEIYEMRFGDLGLDKVTLSRAHDSIVAFLDAYNWRMLAGREGREPEELRQDILRTQERAVEPSKPHTP